MTPLTLRELVWRADAGERMAWEKVAWLAYYFAGNKETTPADFNPILIVESKEKQKTRVSEGEVIAFLQQRDAERESK